MPVKNPENKADESAQYLMVVDKIGNHVKQTILSPASFVPRVSGIS